MKIRCLNNSFLLLSFCLSASFAFAEIYKCTGADGKVIFADQPCATGQKASAIKQQVISGSGAETVPGAANSKKNPTNYKLRPEYAECLKLRDSLAEFFNNSSTKKDPNNKGELTVAEFMGGEKQFAKVKIELARYKEICSIVDKEGGRELASKRAAEEKPQRDAEDAARCQMEREQLKSQRETIAAAGRSTDQLTAQESQNRAKEITELEQSTQAFARKIEKDCSQR